jgi:biopolymer transport protein ExbB
MGARRKGLVRVRRAAAAALVAGLLACLGPSCAAAAENGEAPRQPWNAGVSATNTAATEVSAAPVLGATLRQMSSAGGWILKLLAGMALFGVWSVVRLWRASREQHVVPRGLLAELLDCVRAGDLGEARRLCEDRPGPLAAIALQAFDHLRHAPKAGVLLLRDTIETEGTRQADLLLSQTQLLLDIAVIAPMLGLLGTVLGLLQVFGPLGQELAGARALLQAGGMLQALVTIAAGLFVAIPAMACHAWLRRRMVRRIASMESAVSEILMALVGRYDR